MEQNRLFVATSQAKHFGRARCRVTRADDFLAGVPEQFDVWMSHGDQVARVSDEFIALAGTATCPIAAVKHRSLPVLARVKVADAAVAAQSFFQSR